MRPIKNSLHGSEVENDPLKAEVLLPYFLPSAQVVFRRAGQFVSELRDFQNFENLLCGSRICSKI